MRPSVLLSFVAVPALPPIARFNIGLFTRFFAAALAIEMVIALLVVHLQRDYAASGGGYEYVLLIGAACFLIAIRGGGPYSVDRMVGKEL